MLTFFFIESFYKLSIEKVDAFFSEYSNDALIRPANNG
jgi:hypothetical protein